ncbi:hypothetical protein F511_02503 [Dorcoceras hygrometricum]|nr:hypothetical protein F511_02503 [Dorcoceras hygrometricum]
MAESQKNASSSVNLREKNLLLDLDIGKDFLSSWKSMSVAEDDAMDFDFTPVSKGKKKIFSFDKMDEDFNLDGDFGKISSFNMDISDLDISSPPAKDSKLKEKLQVGSTSEDVKGKSDRFTFAFDFNELESFNFEPNIDKGPKSRENKGNFESSPNESGCQDKEDASGMNMIENSSTLAEDPKKPSVPRTAIDFDMVCQVGTADSEHARKNGCSLLETDCPGVSNLSITTEEGASDRDNTSLEPAIATRSQPKIIQSEKFISPEQNDLEVCAGKNAIPDLSSNTLLDNEPIFGDSEDILDRVGLTSSVGEQDANAPSLSTSGFNEHLASENSYQPQRDAILEKNNGEKIQDGIEICVKGNKERTELGHIVSLVEKSCMTSVTPAQFSNIQTSSEDQTTASAIQKLVPLSQAVDDPISEKETRPHEACLMPSLQMVKAESNVPKALSTQTRVSLLSSKKMGLTQSSLSDGTREEAHAVGSNYERKLISSSTTNDTEAVKVKSSLKQKEESMRGLDTLSLNLDSSESILKGFNSLAKTGKTDVLRKMPANSAHFADTLKRTLGTSSLKRKTMEECKAVFTMASPPKRLFPSPKGRRNLAETSQKVPDKQVSNHDTKEGDNFVESSKEDEMCFSVESETKIRQAEAYSKELDNICIMLRKKHEEAKELLVQSIVNSNKLLLLNHPLRNMKIYLNRSLV